MFNAPLAAYGFEPADKPDGGGIGGGIESGGGRLDKLGICAGFVGIGANIVFAAGLFSELGDTLFITIGVNEVLGKVKLGWSKKEAALLAGGGLNKFGDCLNAGWASVGFCKSLTSTDGVLLCCTGWKWFALGGKTLMGCILPIDVFMLNASFIKLLVLARFTFKLGLN